MHHCESLTMSAPHSSTTYWYLHHSDPVLMHARTWSSVNACTTVHRMHPLCMHPFDTINACIDCIDHCASLSMHSPLRSYINACTTVLLPHSAYRTLSKSPAGLTISSAFLLPFLPWASAVLDYFSRVVMSNFNWRGTVKGWGRTSRNGRGFMSFRWVGGKGAWSVKRFRKSQIRKFAEWNFFLY